MEAPMMPTFGMCVECGCPVERTGWDELCFACQEREDAERLDAVFEAQAAWLQQRPEQGGTPEAAERRPPESVAGRMADRPGEAAIRADALKWREIAARDGGGIDRKAEETLALLDELDRLRLVEAEYEALVQWQQSQVRDPMRRYRIAESGEREE